MRAMLAHTVTLCVALPTNVWADSQVCVDAVFDQIDVITSGMHWSPGDTSD